MIIHPKTGETILPDDVKDPQESAIPNNNNASPSTSGDPKTNIDKYFQLHSVLDSQGGSDG